MLCTAKLQTGRSSLIKLQCECIHVCVAKFKSEMCFSGLLFVLLFCCRLSIIPYYLYLTFTQRSTTFHGWRWFACSSSLICSFLSFRALLTELYPLKCSWVYSNGYWGWYPSPVVSITFFIFHSELYFEPWLLGAMLLFCIEWAVFHTWAGLIYI